MQQIAQNFQSLKTHRTFWKKKNRYDCWKNFEKKEIFQIIVSKYR
jgi:hypothetical protein